MELLSKVSFSTKKKIGHTDEERQNVMKFLIQYKKEANTLEKNME